MRAFSASLRKLIGDAEGMRPLLCDGNPLTCTVALVGANPGSTTPFWEFWSDKRGVDRRGWILAYQLQHGGKFNRSRSAIERFVPQVAARVIELNAFPKQSKRIGNLAHSHRSMDVLHFVLNAVRPKIIVSAGRDALNAIQSISYSWSPVVLEGRHFIYWGKESEALLAAKINQLL